MNGKKIKKEGIGENSISIRKVIICIMLAITLVAIIVGVVLFNNGSKQKFEHQYEAFVKMCATYKLGDNKDEYVKLCDNAEKAISGNDKKEFSRLTAAFDEFEIKMTEYQKQLDSYKNIDNDYQRYFDLLYMEDDETTDFLELKKQLTEAKKEASVAAIEDVVGQLEKEYDSIKEKNIEQIATKKAEISQYILDDLLQAEKEIINSYQDISDKSKEEKNYKQAIINLNECLALCKKIQLVNNYNFSVEQIDVSDFPKIKLYISSYNCENDSEIPLLANYLTVRQLGKDGYAKIGNLKVSKLNQQEQLNTCLVADVSGSMYGFLDNVEDAMYDFVNCLQFDKAQDEVSLITFDDCVYETMDFTNDKNKALNAVKNLYIGDCTSLYDALYVAVCKTSRTKGAKCVMAFTDGYDNTSEKTAQDVIRMANALEIPIYLIGIGPDVESSELNDICENTGGFFRQIWDSKEMTEIYKSAFQKNKEMYLVEYDSGAENMDEAQSIYVAYDNGDEYLRCESDFIPEELQADAKEYESIIADEQLKTEDIEDEVLKIRADYNDIVKKISDGIYTKTNLGKDVVAYSQNGKIYSVVVGKGVNGSSYTRYYYYKDDKLIFAYIEGTDSHRLYFYNDRLFRWRYAKNAVKFSEADNHDNEDSPDFLKWQEFALDEAYQYTKK